MSTPAIDNHSPNPQTSSPGRQPNIVAAHRAKARHQNACDACRSRKVRCVYDLESEPCQGCVFLEIDCTRWKPRRKRGPPNRHTRTPARVETPKPRVHPVSLVSPSGQVSTPLSHSSLDIAVSTTRSHESCSVGLRPWLASFAPEPVISRMLSNWFDKVHPVAPILFRRRFLRRLRQGEADVDRTFCGLVVSVCAAVAATLPREDYGSVTVTRCLDYISQNGLITSGFTKSTYSVDWCIAMYNIGTAVGTITEAGFSDVQSYHALAEATAGVRYLMYYCMHDLDNVEKQLIKRLFWLLFAGSCSANMLGRLSVSLVSQELVGSIPRPLDLTDDQMDLDDVLNSDDVAWHGDTTSYVPGLNSLSDLFSIWHELLTTSIPRDSEACLKEYLARVQSVIDGLPPQLRWRGGLSRSPNVTQGHDVQIANIFITSLHIRSNLLQKLDPTHKSIPEHQKIVDDLLEILYHLPQAVFNANGSSVVPKIRDIGAAYLEQVERGHGTGQADSDSARSKLERVLRKLDDLDCWQGLGVIDGCRISGNN